MCAAEHLGVCMRRIFLAVLPFTAHRSAYLQSWKRRHPDRVSARGPFGGQLPSQVVSVQGLFARKVHTGVAEWLQARLTTYCAATGTVGL